MEAVDASDDAHVPPPVGSLRVMFAPVHTDVGPMMLVVVPLTLMAAVAVQPAVAANVIVAVPVATPLTTPLEASTEAILLAEELHDPTPVVVSGMVAPMQTVDGPEIVGWVSLTLTVVAVIHPDGIVYEMMDVPEPTPVRMPVVAPTTAMPV